MESWQEVFIHWKGFHLGSVVLNLLGVFACWKLAYSRSPNKESKDGLVAVPALVFDVWKELPLTHSRYHWLVAQVTLDDQVARFDSALKAQFIHTFWRHNVAQLQTCSQFSPVWWVRVNAVYLLFVLIAWDSKELINVLLLKGSSWTGFRVKLLRTFLEGNYNIYLVRVMTLNSIFEPFNDVFIDAFIAIQM